MHTTTTLKFAKVGSYYADLSSPPGKIGIEVKKNETISTFFDSNDTTIFRNHTVIWTYSGDNPAEYISNELTFTPDLKILLSYNVADKVFDVYVYGKDESIPAIKSATTTKHYCGSVNPNDVGVPEKGRTSSVSIKHFFAALILILSIVGMLALTLYYFYFGRFNK